MLCSNDNLLPVPARFSSDESVIRARVERTHVVSARGLPSSSLEAVIIMDALIYIYNHADV